jgi:hypothetical protein
LANELGVVNTDASQVNAWQRYQVPLVNKYLTAFSDPRIHDNRASAPTQSIAKLPLPVSANCEGDFVVISLDAPNVAVILEPLS